MWVLWVVCMLSKAGVKLLKTVYEALPDNLHLREISRRSKVSSETAHRLLHQLAGEDVLTYWEEGKEKIFALNLSNPFVPKYYEFIKGRAAKDLYAGDAKIEEIRDEVIQKIGARTERKYSVLLMSTQPFKIFLVVDNADYTGMIDAVESLQGNLKLKFPDLSIVAMSEEGLAKNLEDYPEMREVIKKTTPLYGSENFFKVLFDYWRRKHDEDLREKRTRPDQARDGNDTAQPPTG